MFRWQQVAIGAGVVAAGALLSMPFRRIEPAQPKTAPKQQLNLHHSRASESAKATVTANVLAESPDRSTETRSLAPPVALAKPLRAGLADEPSRTADPPQASVTQLQSSAPTMASRLQDVVETPVTRPGHPRMARPEIRARPQIPQRRDPRVARRATPPPEAVVHHRIVDGDSLPALAKHYLGDANRFMEIFDANRNVLRDPELLPIGVKLRIGGRPATAAPQPSAGVMRPL